MVVSRPAAERLPGDIQEGLLVLDADEGIDLGDFILQIFPVAFDQASHHHQFLPGIALFELGQFEDGIDGFFFGRVEKSACIDNQKVSLVGIVNQHHAGEGEFGEHLFALHQVFRASQGDEIILEHVFLHFRIADGRFGIGELSHGTMFPHSCVIDGLTRGGL